MDTEQKPLHPALVFAKTAKGTAEIATRSGTLSLPMRRILIIIDGKRPVRELLPYVRTGELEKIMSALKASGMIEETGYAGAGAAEQAAQPPNVEVKAAADAGAATERRAPAAPVVPVTHPGPPATVNVPLGAAATLETPASRPVSATGVARPATLSGTPTSPMPGSASRPPTLNGASRPPTLNGTPRPPTLNGTPRPATLTESRGAAAATQAQAQTPNGQPRPPMLSGATAAQKSPPPTLSGATRPPTLGGNGSKVAVPASAQPVSQAASPAAAEPASLEESKRKAVRELYDRLGPYGEEPAARIQSCTTLDALREELRYAGKRVATFRGEKAAQEYLASMARFATAANA